MDPTAFLGPTNSKALSSSHDFVPEETAGMQWVEDATDIEVVLAITYEACSGRWAVQTP